MNASELTESERLALMALLKLMISADQQLSNQESQVLKGIAAEIGVDVFKTAQQQAQASLKKMDDLKDAIAAVTRPEARQLLYTLAYKAAESDQLIKEEIKRLFWVAEQWGLDVDPSTGHLREA